MATGDAHDEVPGNDVFRHLPAHERAVVAVAVLLDGFESVDYLALDRVNGGRLSEAAAGLAGLEPELRMPFVGTLLRRAIEECEG